MPSTTQHCTIRKPSEIQQIQGYFRVWCYKMMHTVFTLGQLHTTNKSQRSPSEECLITPGSGYKSYNLLMLKFPVARSLFNDHSYARIVFLLLNGYQIQSWQ